MILEPRKYELIEGGVFSAEICPIFDRDKAIAAGLEPVEQEALDVTHKTQEQLEKAADLATVWKDFTKFVARYQKAGSKSSWDAPIPCGYNIKNFDSVIIRRLCEQYGPFDDKFQSQKLFHPIHSIDLMDDFWRWTDNYKINDKNSLSLDSVRDWLGMQKAGAHDALNDVLDCAEILRRFAGRYRDMFSKTKFQGALAQWKRPVVRI